MSKIPIINYQGLLNQITPIIEAKKVEESWLASVKPFVAIIPWKRKYFIRN